MIAAIYARKSTEQTGVAADQKSVARQIEHAHAYAARKGWRVAAEYVYVDDGISGAEFTNRPGFIRLMTALKPKPPFNVLIMSEESRLGREQIATGYALQQIITAGVRVFSYMEDRERTLNSPIEKVMLSLQTMTDEMEREKARQRAIDTSARKARAGHVTGGRCFGYRNVVVTDAAGQRSHVTREIDDAEAAVVRQIFRLCADGYGTKAIAKTLNRQERTSPRAQQGRSQSWSPTSVRAVLFRPLYRGEIVWNQTRNCDRWGQTKRSSRPEDEWVRVQARDLQIVDDAVWDAAHRRIAASRALYLRSTNGRTFGRPAVGSPSKYLLTNFAQCGVCGNPLRVCTRSHGKTRARFYGCTGYHDRGRTVCANGADIPMAEADGIVLETLLDELLDASRVSRAIDAAIGFLQGDATPSREEAIHQELGRLQNERANLVRAIASAGELDDLLIALRERDARRVTLERELSTLPPIVRVSAADVRRVRQEVTALAKEWRQVLIDGGEHARPIVSALLRGRVTFKPLAKSQYELRGSGSYAGLFTKVFSIGGTSPTGTVLGGISVGGTSPAGTETGGQIDFLRKFRAA